ncbi:MAG: hypothetical protein ACRC46_08870 [Thermoguttaceae bacterium]
MKSSPKPSPRVRDMNADKDVAQALQNVLGYIQFSSGQRDPQFFTSLNTLYADQLNEQTATNDAGNSVVRQLLTRLDNELDSLAGKVEAFRDVAPGRRLIRFVRDTFLDAYRQFHSDLFFHQNEDALFNSFLLAKVFETLLARSEPLTNETDTTTVVAEMLDAVCDLIGYRPVPVLEGEQRHQPNAHEWVAPIPLWIRGIGAATGKYRELLEAALNMFDGVDGDIVRESGLEPSCLTEIVLDPRAYDFDHPVNRRPNYHFGYWDPTAIDNSGQYYRYVVHQVLLDCALARVDTAYMGDSTVSNVPRDELVYESGAVLLGTMLMGSGVTGSGPSAYDSTVTINSLMPIIAGYRDRFYTSLLERTPEKIKTRLVEEERQLFQPFGGARQDLNKRLAKRRADQLQRLHLARTYARMGYFDAAREQTEIIAVASARMLCQIDCLITEGHFLLDRDNVDPAAKIPAQLEELIRRGIACGAIVDPWTILGFGAQFSLFQSAENSIHDHRIDDLINILDDVFDFYSRLLKSAAAAGLDDLRADLSDQMSDLAGWWDQYGVTEVSSVEGFSGAAAWESAAQVATALAAWNKAGTAAGDIAFWSRHVERFNSPKAFVLLAEALLERGDLVATMALLMYWLSHSETIPLTEANYSFHTIVLRWNEQLWRTDPAANESGGDAAVNPAPHIPRLTHSERWALATKFFDYLEANADFYGTVPDVELDDSFFEQPKATRGGNKSAQRGKRGPNVASDPNQDDNDVMKAAFDSFFEDGDTAQRRPTGSDPLYGAAYENMTFQDSADDGFDDNLMDAPGPSFGDDDEEFELTHETERISERLSFLVTVCKSWKFTAIRAPQLVAPADAGSSDSTSGGSETSRLEDWLSQSVRYWNDLQQLLDKVSRYKVPVPRGTPDSLASYDRHRGTKEILIDRIIWTMVEVADGILILQAVLGSPTITMTNKAWEKPVCQVLSAILRRDVNGACGAWKKMLKALASESLLYIPTARGGPASAIVACRSLQQVILRLFEFAPRLGLLSETFSLLEQIEEMERVFPAKSGAITEYDRLVEAATQSIATCIAESSKTWVIRRTSSQFSTSADALVDYLERIVELLLDAWLSHSRQIRISPLESVGDRAVWNAIKEFIQRYGEDIFTQQFMAFGNLRAILHQGVETYLTQLLQMREDDDEPEFGARLLADIDSGTIAMEEAVASLELIFEAIAENYSEYIDYNSTTTHSDHGEKLYMLLDMLRVLAGYERISWNLKPVYWIHNAMIRAECLDAAKLWETAVANRSVTAADEHIRRYQRLSTKYGLWIPSIFERLQERFIRPLQIDRMCGLVPKAIREAKLPHSQRETFRILAAQVEIFAMAPAGVGYEIPEWLAAFQDEAMATRIDAKTGEDQSHFFEIVPPFERVRLTRGEVDKIIQGISRSRLNR